MKGGGEMMTPKQIAKYLKSKGYGKPWLYCQVCRKQCRDDNGFKCHTESIQHLRNMEVFLENKDQYIAAYSAEFERGMLDVMRTTFQNQKVYITTVHRVYSRARSQVRLNGTQWATLEEFCEYLAKTGKAEVFETDKGPEVLYTGKDVEQERMVKEREVMKNEQDRLMIEIENRIKKTQELQKQQAEAQQNNENNNASENKAGELDLEKKGEIKFALNIAKKQTVPVNKTQKDDVEQIQEITIGAPTKQPETQTTKQETEPKPKDTKPTPTTKSEEKKRKEPETTKTAPTETKKKKSTRKENWICPGIVVKILNKNLQDGKFYKQKGVVEKVIDDFVALLRVLDLNLKIKIDQAELETVIPRIGNKVQVVNGTYRGETATLMAIDEQKYRAQVKIETGPEAGALSWEEYEDICKLHTD